jgi:hypothetical protein
MNVDLEINSRFKEYIKFVDSGQGYVLGAKRLKEKKQMPTLAERDMVAICHFFQNTVEGEVQEQDPANLWRLPTDRRVRLALVLRSSLRVLNLRSLSSPVVFFPWRRRQRSLV